MSHGDVAAVAGLDGGEILAERWESRAAGDGASGMPDLGASSVGDCR